MYAKNQNIRHNIPSAGGGGMLVPLNYGGTAIERGQRAIYRRASGEVRLTGESVSETVKTPVKESPATHMMRENLSGRSAEKDANDASGEKIKADDPITPSRLEDRDTPKYWQNDTKGRMPPSPPKDFGRLHGKKTREDPTPQPDGREENRNDRNEIFFDDIREDAREDVREDAVAASAMIREKSERHGGILDNISYEDLLIVGLILLLRQNDADAETIMFLSALLLF